MALRFSPSRNSASVVLSAFVRGPAGPAGTDAVSEPDVIVTGSSGSVDAGDTFIVITRVGPTLTEISLPSVTAQGNKRLVVKDWSTSIVSDHEIRLTPSGSETIDRAATYSGWSNSSALTVIKLRPSQLLSGWIVE
jgi:hypothetical protein